MGLGPDGVMMYVPILRLNIALMVASSIHMGGIYGDKPSTLARFKENYTTKLSENVMKRLVLENDEVSTSAPGDP